jgi:sec-independent protein translocase protein TatA
MVGDLFDSPWKILIIAVVIIVIFGSKKLPYAARSLGQSMRILKKEVQGLHEDEPESYSAGAQAPAPAEISAAPGQQAQIDALEQKIRDMQRASTMDATPKTPAEASTQQPG